MSNNQIGPYIYYPLDTAGDVHLLGEDQELTVNLETGVVLLMDWQTRTIKAETHFGWQEIVVVNTLLSSWPAYVPYELLLAILTRVDVGTLVEQIERARETPELHTIIAPVQNVILALQERVNLFGLTVAAVYQHGYLLIRLPSRKDSTYAPDHD